MKFQFIIDPKDGRILARGTGKAFYSMKGMETLLLDVTDEESKKLDYGYKGSIKNGKLILEKTPNVENRDLKKDQYKTLKEKAKKRIMTMTDVQDFIEKFC